MARYILIALNGPTDGEGDEETYNNWYTDVHVKDVLSTPGVTAADRYKVVQGAEQWPYVAIYQIETDDLAATFQALGTNASDFHPTFDRSKSAHIVAVALDPADEAGATS